MPHRKTVVKFGGSNLKTATDIDRVATIAQAYASPLVIVVSAFYGITNALIECVKAASSPARSDTPDATSISFTKGLRALKRTIIDASIADKTTRERVWKEVGERMDRLERYLLGIHYIGDLPDFLSDAVLSYGERLSSLILAAALRSRGLDCEEVLPEDLGLVTDGEFGNATCDFEGCEASVAARLAADRVFVVPGFYGVGPDGRTTLFGRGGSDYSAAALARCVGASSLDVWKDVRGFLSADPREVGEPLRIASLSYSEAAELSYFGARILHPRTVEPLFDRGIPVRVLDVDAWKPGDPMVPGTIIDGSGQIAKGRVKAVSSSEDIGILTLQGPGVGFKRGILAQATGSLDARGINIKSVITAQTAINILVGREDLVEARKTLGEHHVAGVVDLSMNKDAAIVAIVGEGILDGTPPLALASRALQAVSDAGIHIFLATAGASDVALYLLVPRSERLTAVRKIHAEFFGGSA